MKNFLIPSIALVMMVVVATLQVSAMKTEVCDVPKAHLMEIPNFTSKPLEISESEKAVLPADTYIEKRLYTAPNAHWFKVSLVISGKGKNSIHRPELCLPSHGFLMTNPHTVNVEDTSWRFITLECNGYRETMGFAYTFFNQAGYRTSSHTARIFRDVWDRSMLGRIDRWAMVTVNSSRSDDLGMKEFLSKLKGVFE